MEASALMMALAAPLLATQPSERVTGRVTYSQQIVAELGWITGAKGRRLRQPRQRLLPAVTRFCEEAACRPSIVVGSW
jgi:hypothetical protein